MDTNFLADFPRVSSRGSWRPCEYPSAEVGAGCSGVPWQSACRFCGAHLLRRAQPIQLSRLVRGLLSEARFSSRGCPLEMRACTRTCSVHDKLWCIHVYKITRRRIPKFRVGPMGFQLNGSSEHIGFCC